MTLFYYQKWAGKFALRTAQMLRLENQLSQQVMRACLLCALSRECVRASLLNTGDIVKLRYNGAQCPYLGTASYCLVLTDVFNQTPFRVPWEASSLVAINARII